MDLVLCDKIEKEGGEYLMGEKEESSYIPDNLLNVARQQVARQPLPGEISPTAEIKSMPTVEMIRLMVVANEAIAEARENKSKS